MRVRFGRLCAATAFPLLLLSIVCSLVHGQQTEECLDNGMDSEKRREYKGNNTPQYLIVGAGGSGLQTALFLEKYKLSYVILEKTHQVGSFFSQFPRFEELISVNKWVNNATQRMRYDWHSMLEAPLLMYNITQDYFPTGKDWQRYMTEVAKRSGILRNIEFGVEVEEVAKNGSPCVLLTDGTTRCASHRVFMGTGLREKPEPLLRQIGGVPYSRVTKEMARHRRVCIAGNGNSGYEVAQNVYDVADRVAIYGKHPNRLSSVTRYTGDVRVKYLQVLENLNGKLLDTADYFHWAPKVHGLDGILNEAQIAAIKDVILVASWLRFWECDLFVIATGFESYVPGMKLESRFPSTKKWYESTVNPSVHYIGWLMHEADFRKGAGGFFSGFRYLIRNLIHHVRFEDEGIPYPFHVQTKEQAIAHALARIQTADDLIILQDGVVLRDMIVPTNDGSELYHYYEGISFQFHQDFKDRNDVISLYFAWGKKRGRSPLNVFDGIIRYDDTSFLLNVFLHPVIEVSGLSRDVQEDLEHAWLRAEYVDACDKTIRAAFDGNFTLFQPKSGVVPYIRPRLNQTGPHDFEPAHVGATIDQEFVNVLWRAVQADKGPEHVTMQRLHSAAKSTLSFLFPDE